MKRTTPRPHAPHAPPTPRAPAPRAPAPRAPAPVGRGARGARRAALAGLAALALLAPAFAGCVGRGSAGDGASGEGALRVAIEGPSSASVGDTVTLLGAAVGVPEGGGFWFWDFGDGVEHQNVGLREVEHEFSESGAYRVTLTVVDAEGKRGVATHVVGVSQEFEFEGTVASANALGVGEQRWESAFPTGPGAASIVLDARFEPGGPLPAPLAASAAAAQGGAAPRVVVRLVAPADGNATSPEDVVLLEVPLDVPAEGKRLRAEVPAERFATPGDVVLEVASERGTVHFVATLRVTFAPAASEA